MTEDLVPLHRREVRAGVMSGDLWGRFARPGRLGHGTYCPAAKTILAGPRSPVYYTPLVGGVGHYALADRQRATTHMRVQLTANPMIERGWCQCRLVGRGSYTDA